MTRTLTSLTTLAFAGSLLLSVPAFARDGRANDERLAPTPVAQTLSLSVEDEAPAVPPFHSVDGRK